MSRWFVRADERGQASLVGLAIITGCVALALLLVTVTRAYLAQAQLQKAADIAAAAAARGGDRPGSEAAKLARANGARTVEFATRNGRDVVTVTGEFRAVDGVPLSMSLRAQAVIVPLAVSSTSSPGFALTPGGYRGPLVSVDGVPICPGVAEDYRAMQRSAAAAGITLHANSGYRSAAEQAVLYAQLGPGLAAPPGQSLHQQATELDINVGAAGSPTHTWLTANAGRYSFIQRYSWEPWHWGNVRGC